MDSLIAASARALAAGDPVGALGRVALRDDPPALALRGIAMAQLDEHALARDLLRRAARGFGPQQPLSRARCVVAEAEVALAMRDLGGSSRALVVATATLDARGDRGNALHARLVAVRRLLLLGRLDESADALARLDVRGLAPSLVATAALAAAELALRGLRIAEAERALADAQAAAERAGVPALIAEVADARAALERPAARRIVSGRQESLRLDAVASLLASGALVVDACRHGLHAADAWLPLSRRPVLFALARVLAEAWPGHVDRESLIVRVFRTRRPDDSHRARLRVEIGRLRRLVASMATVDATTRGFVLGPLAGREVVLLAPPIDGDQGSLVALLGDGAAWSTSALALALGSSQRTVQRALVDLEAEGRVRAVGRARSRRWLAPSLAGFTTILLLPASLPLD